MSPLSAGTARQPAATADRETARIVSLPEVITQPSQDAPLRSSGWIWITFLITRSLFV